MNICMKEFTTEESGNINERRKEPKRNRDRIIFYSFGAAMLTVCIVCLLLLWHKTANRDKTELKVEGYTEASDTILAKAPEASLSELQEQASGEAAETTALEVIGEEKRQQYLTNVEHLREKVESLLQSMTKTKATLEEVIQAQEGDTALKEQVSEITSEITSLTLQLQIAQERIRELKESITVMNNETILTVQGSIDEIETQMTTMNSDISDIYTKIDALKTMDVNLQKKIDDIEKDLKSTAEQNMTEVTNQFGTVSDKMQQLESWILRYRYDAESVTLYLYPN